MSQDHNKESESLIAALKLLPHPEGGYYREMFRDPAPYGGRAHSTAIYYLLREDQVSLLHRIDAVEIWHFYRGAPLELTIVEEGKPAQQHILGPKIENGERPQIVIPAGAWQGARPLGAFTLVGCTVAPGFEFSRFELAPPDYQAR